MNEQGYMGVREAAKLWGVSEGTVRKWCREGLLAAVPKKDGANGAWRIPRGAERIEKRTAKIRKTANKNPKISMEG